MCVCVQKNAWHPPEGKCHILRRHRGTRVLVPCRETPYLKVAFGKGFGYALMRTIEKQYVKDQKRRAQQLQQNKRSLDEDGEVQHLAVLKRIKRAA